MSRAWTAIKASPWWIKATAAAIVAVLIALGLTGGGTSPRRQVSASGTTTTVALQPLAPGSPTSSPSSTSTSSTVAATTSTTTGTTSTTTAKVTTTVAPTTTTTRPPAPCTITLSNATPSPANPQETVSADAAGITTAGVPATLVVNYRHLAPFTENGSSGSAGLVVFPTFTVKHDGHGPTTVTVDVTIGSGSQAAACSSTFTDGV